MAVHYERLSNLDASFLSLESRSSHMHVGAVAVFGPGPSVGDEGVDIDLIRGLVDARLEAIPRYRQRLMFVPFERHPVWIDDDHFQLDYHVRHFAVPHPGTDDQLKALVGRLMSQQLDRTRPLWELFVVEGLESGGFAIVSKTHHCMIDGVSGIELMAVLLDFSPEVEIKEPELFVPRPAPNGTELAVKEASRSISRMLGAVSDVSAIARNVEDVREDLGHRLRAAGASLSSGWLSRADKTPLNGEIGPARWFDWVSCDLAEVKAIKNEHDCTVNDAMLAVVTGGVRNYMLEEAGVSELDVASMEFRIMAPVSVRSENESGKLGNKIAMWLMELPIGEKDPVKRIQIIRDETRNLKETNQALGASTLVDVSTGAPSSLVSLAVRVASRGVRPFNMTVTNVPGPQFPMYLAGSQMLATYPLVPLWQTHGVGVAMFSLNGRVNCGINMDRAVIDDPGAFGRACLEAFEELKATPAAKAKPRKAPPLGTR